MCRYLQDLSHILDDLLHRLECILSLEELSLGLVHGLGNPLEDIARLADHLRIEMGKDSGGRTRGTCWQWHSATQPMRHQPPPPFPPSPARPPQPRPQHVETRAGICVCCPDQASQGPTNHRHPAAQQAPAQHIQPASSSVVPHAQTHTLPSPACDVRTASSTTLPPLPPLPPTPASAACETGVQRRASERERAAAESCGSIALSPHHHPFLPSPARPHGRGHNTWRLDLGSVFVARIRLPRVPPVTSAPRQPQQKNRASPTSPSVATHTTSLSLSHPPTIGRAVRAPQ